MSASIFSAERAMATVYTYTPTSTTTDTWSAGTDWSATPVSAATTELTFVSPNTTVLASGLTNTNTDNISGAFSLNILDLQGTGPASGSAAAINISSASPATGLAFALNGTTLPVINLNALNGSSGLTYTVTAPISSNASSFVIQGAGTANFNFADNITTSSTTSFYKLGTSILTLAGTDTFAGSFYFGRDTTGLGNASGTIVAAPGAVISIGSGTSNLVYIAANSTGTTAGSAVMNLSNAASFTASVNSFYIGNGTSGNSSLNGTLILGGTSNITAPNSFEVGDITTAQVTPQLSLLQVANNAAVNIKTNRFLQSYAKANGNVTFGTGDTFNLSGGTAGTRAEMDIGNETIGTSSSTTGTFDASGAGDVVNLYLSFLVIGSDNQSSPSSTGSVTDSMILSSSNLNHLDLAFNTSSSLGVLTVGRQVNTSASTATGGTGTLTINGLDNTSSIVATDNGPAIVVGTTNVAGKASGTVNFNNSGTLTVTTTGSAIQGSLNVSGNSTVNFNGMTLKAGASTASGKQWITGLTSANIGDNGAIFDTGGFNVNTNQVFQHGSGVYNNNATDGGITKNGLGTLTMTGTSTYNGATTVNAGTLALSGSLTSTINVNNTATLNFTGSTSDGINANTGSTLVGVGTAAGALNFAGNDLLEFDPTNSSFLTAGSINASSATVTVTPLSTPSGTGITILSASGGITGAIGTNFMPSSRGTLYFNNPASPTALLFNSSSAASLVWQGSNASNPTFWDLHTTANFNNSGTTDVFYNGDNVVFDDSASSFIVNVQGSLQPGSVAFNNSANTYTLQGGTIGGTTGLVMNGTGKVVITSSNSYTGGTTINSGTIQLGDGTVLTGSLGTGTIVDNGTLATDFGAGSATLTNVISGSGAFNQIGASTLHITSANPSFSGTTTISNGTLQLDNSGTLGTGPIVDNAALIGNASATLPNNISGTGTVAVAGTNTLTLTGSNTYTGNTTIPSGATLAIGANGTSGSINAGAILNSGTVSLNRSDTSVVGATINGTGSIVLNAPGTFSLSGNNSAGSVSIGINTAAGSLVVPSGASLTIGTNSSTGSLTVGQATATLSTGTLDASAATAFTVDVATVLIGNNATTGGVAGTGTLKLPANSTITAGSSFQAGSTGGAYGSTSLVTTANGPGTVSILTPQLYVGFQKSHGTLTVGTGNTLNISGVAANSSTTLFVGYNLFNGTGTWNGLFDGSAGTVTANLNGLFIGNKVSATGASFVDGQFILGTSAANQLVITGTTGAGGLVTVGTVGSGDTNGTSTGTLTIGNLNNSSVITTTDTGPAIYVGSGGVNSTTYGTGVVNLNGGRLAFNSSNATPGAAIKGGTGFSTLNLNGATIASNVSNSNFITGLTAVNVRNGGVTFDTESNNVTIAQSLSHSATGTVGAVTIASMGSSYTTVPTVTISSGNVGSTGTATATIDGNGNVSGIALNNVQNFAVAPTLTISGGGGSGATATVAYTPDNAIDGGLTKLGTGTLTLSGTNTYTGGTNISNGTVAAASNSALGTGAANLATATTLSLGLNGSSTSAVVLINAVNVANSATATLQLAPTANYSSGTVGAVTVGTAATLNLTSPSGVAKGVLTAPSIAASASVFNVGLNALDLTNQSVGSVTTLVASAYNGGSWNGSGISSSAAASSTSHLTALGIAPASVLSGGTIDGITPGANDTLVKYTYYGDANLSGTVDGSDYTLIDAGFNSNGTLTGWANGDFNYDSKIDGSDYTLIDNAFNTQGVSLAAQIAPLAAPSSQFGGSSSAAVPEPTSLGLVGVAAAGLLGRRRRRNTQKLP